MNKNKYFEFEITFLDGNIANAGVFAEDILGAWGIIIQNYMDLLEKICDIGVIR